jgi:hypothetical protein
MVRKKGPCVTTGLAFGKNTAAPVKKVMSIGNAGEDRPPFYSPHNNMVENAGCIETGFTGHEEMVSTVRGNVKVILNYLRTSPNPL